MNKDGTVIGKEKTRPSSLQKCTTLERHPASLICGRLVSTYITFVTTVSPFSLESLTK